jgi:hypothetical protein
MVAASLVGKDDCHAYHGYYRSFELRLWRQLALSAHYTSDLETETDRGLQA